MITGGAARTSRDGTMFFCVHMGEFVRVCGWVLGLKKKKNKMSDFSSGVYIHFAPGK